MIVVANRRAGGGGGGGGHPLWAVDCGGSGDGDVLGAVTTMPVGHYCDDYRATPSY